MSLFKEFGRDLDQPVPWEEKGYFKKGKLRVIVLNEDLSGTIFWRKFPKSYVFDIKGKYYFLVPKCVLNLDFPTIVYFYNNPKPIFFGFQKSDLKAVSLYSPEELVKVPEAERFILTGTYIDAEQIKLFGNALYMRGLVPQGFRPWKVLLIFLVALAVIALVILQLTCKADFMNLKMCDKKMFLPLLPWLWQRRKTL